MFWNSPIFMSRIAEHFTVRKHENIPICRRTNARIAKITEKLEEEEEYQMGSPTQSILKLSGRERVFLNEKVLIKEQLGNNNDKSNTVTKDYLAILSYNTMVSTSANDPLVRPCVFLKISGNKTNFM